jgi:hypothetical protein
MELKSVVVVLTFVVSLLVGPSDGAAVMSIDFGSEWIKVILIFCHK